MYKLADSTWWRGVATALIRTLIAAAAPFAAAAMATPEVMTQSAWWLNVALVVGLAVILAIATAMAGLPDPSGSWWQIGLQRAVRQAAQYLVAASAGAALLSDLSPQIWIATLGSAAATFALAAMSLGVNPVSDDDIQDGTTEGEGGFEETVSSDADTLNINGGVEVGGTGEEGTAAPSGGGAAVDAAGFSTV